MDQCDGKECTLAVGPHTRVLKASDQSGDTVCIKVYEKEAWKSAKREIFALQTLKGLPHIVQMMSFFRTEQQETHIVMPYFEGTLFDYVQESGGRLGEAEAVGLFRQMITAVHACHRHSLCHRG